jgi:hypothetical protein
MLEVVSGLKRRDLPADTPMPSVPTLHKVSFWSAQSRPRQRRAFVDPSKTSDSSSLER